MRKGWAAGCGGVASACFNFCACHGYVHIPMVILHDLTHVFQSRVRPAPSRVRARRSSSTSVDESTRAPIWPLSRTTIQHEVCGDVRQELPAGGSRSLKAYEDGLALIGPNEGTERLSHCCTLAQAGLHRLEKEQLTID